MWHAAVLHQLKHNSWVSRVRWQKNVHHVHFMGCFWVRSFWCMVSDYSAGAIRTGRAATSAGVALWFFSQMKNIHTSYSYDFCGCANAQRVWEGFGIDGALGVEVLPVVQWYNSSSYRNRSPQKAQGEYSIPCFPLAVACTLLHWYLVGCRTEPGWYLFSQPMSSNLWRGWETIKDYIGGVHTYHQL